MSCRYCNNRILSFRRAFLGKADYLVNFFRFLAEDVREHLAELGYRKMDEIIGRVISLERNRM